MSTESPRIKVPASPCQHQQNHINENCSKRKSQVSHYQRVAVLAQDARNVVEGLPVVQVAAEAIVVAGIGVSTSTTL
jgi:hypothetical protein